MECKNCKKDRTIRAKELCSSCYERQLLDKNPERKRAVKEYRKEYHEKNADKLKTYYRDREKLRSTDPKYKERRRNSFYFRKYGITSKEFDERKGKGCELCGEKSTTMHADHDHNSGKLRGVLCSKCNNGLGFFNDNSSYLRRAAEYLDRS